MSSDSSHVHHVFVDFENVPSVDLTLIAELPVRVTLLIGGMQNKLDTHLAEQIHTHAAKVRFIRLAGSGRNALDLTLAYYLGRAVAEYDKAELHIVSKDKDFEPLIAHLRARKVTITRTESFAALPFLSPIKPAAVTRQRRTPQKKPAEIVKELPLDRIGKVFARLQNPLSRNRPSTERALRAHLRTALGKESSEERIETVLGQLQTKRVLTIEPKGRVVYDDSSATSSAGIKPAE
jgi:hypothetical protein